MGLLDFAGFGIRGYRSFGAEDHTAMFGPMSKIHLVTGQNNTGKSNALHFMADVMSAVGKSHGSGDLARLYSGALDVPNDWSADQVRLISLGLYLTDAVRTSLRFENKIVSDWLQTEAYSRGNKNTVWFDFEIEQSPLGNTFVLKLSRDQVENAGKEATRFTTGHLGQVSNELSSGSSSDIAANLGNILRVWQPWQWIPEVRWVDAIREITADEGHDYFRNGAGLVPHLARLERPSYDTHQQDSARFEGLQAFVRDVLEDPEAGIQIPDAKDTVLVRTRRGLMELDKVGTGIGEVILLAAVASTTKQELICVEEPEAHLHPTLQRKLVAYLHEHTDNHYLMSTHSAQLVNAEISTITHIEMPEKWSIAHQVVDPMGLAHVAADLGNRASDLVQSNFVIWVEGPSDRLYVRHWIQMCDPRLTEGAHYSIMFYGGALLSHLTVDDEEVDDYIQLLKINRNLAVLIDSDRKSTADPLNATKRRVIEELATIGAKYVVTDGYTIENYVPRLVLSAALKELYPNHTYVLPKGDYSSPLGKTFQGTKTRPSKVSVARFVVAQNLEWDAWPIGLREELDTIAAGIGQANGISAIATAQ